MNHRPSLSLQIRRRAFLLALCLFCTALTVAGCTGVIEDAPGDESGGLSSTDPTDPNGPTLPDPITPGMPGDLHPDTIDCMTTFDVGESAMRRLTRTEYNNTIRDLLGDATLPALSFAEDEKVGGFDSNAVAPVSQLGVEQYQAAADEIAERAVAESLGALLPCDPAQDGESACADEFIDRFGIRAWRRPLDDAERDRLRSVYDTIRAEGTFEDAIRVLVSAMLQSPNFLYHMEVGEPVAGTPGIVALTPWEVASRLSYFLWGSMPDETLLVLAATGGLDEPGEVRAQAERMLADDKARAAIVDFHHQWLELDHFDSIHKNDTLYPAFDDSLRADMLRETEMFVERIIFEEDGSLYDLLGASHSWVSAELASLYGVSHPGDDGFHRVEFDPAERSGLLTQASLLAMHAKPDQSSPIHRGMFVRERLLCQEIPDPPPGLEVNPPPFDPTLSTRERFAQHREDAACAGCHSLMDPIGFGFENYDAIGGFRSEDGGAPVDASGAFHSTQDVDGDFDGVVEMAEQLAGSEQVRECMAEQWFRFALRRTTGVADTCSYRSAYDAFEASGFRIQSFMLAVTETDSFRYRRVPSM